MSTRRSTLTRRALLAGGGIVGCCVVVSGTGAVSFFLSNRPQSNVGDLAFRTPLRIPPCSKGNRMPMVGRSSISPCKPRRPGSCLRGPKDTVFVGPDHAVKLAVQFASYTDPDTPYMYHCHILRHEDNGMMGQFVVVEPGTEDLVDRTIASEQHH